MGETLLDTKKLKEQIHSLAKPLLERYLDALLIVSEEGFPFFSVGDANEDDELLATFASSLISNQEAHAEKTYLRNMMYILQKAISLKTILVQYVLSLNGTNYVALFLRGFLILAKVKRGIEVGRVVGVMIRQAARILRVLETFAKPITLAPKVKPIAKLAAEVDVFSIYMNFLNEILEIRKKLIGTITWSQLYNELEKFKKAIIQLGMKLNISSDERFKQILTWIDSNLGRIKRILSQAPNAEVPDNAKEVLRKGLMDVLTVIKQILGIS